MQLFSKSLMIILAVLWTTKGESDGSFTDGACRWCSPTRSEEKSSSCSTNERCKCLIMTLNNVGLCADTDVACNELTSCGNDGKTCPTPNTVCVTNTRCKRAVCYPLELTSSERCPWRAPINRTTTPQPVGLCTNEKIFRPDPILLTTFGSGVEQYSLATPSDFNFTTAYRQSYKPTTNGGWFSFINRLDNEWWSWPTDTLDHTPGDVGGYIMVINGKDQPPSEFYRSTINNLCIGLRYKFSVYLANLMSYTAWPRPDATFEVRSPTEGDRLLASVSTGYILESQNLTWLQFNVPFTASSSSVVLSMILTSGGALGNDFAMDDISLNVCLHSGPSFCPSNK